MDIVVQKFGGTSLRSVDHRKQAVELVRATTSAGFGVVVVVSAIGRRPDPYATDTLLGMASAEGADNRGLSDRETDLLLACGEIISATLFAGLMQTSGIPAVALTGAQAGIITDDHFSSAHIIRVTPERVFRELKAGKVVVVAGFQGQTEDGEVTTLGRGGSDTTAVALGAVLKAKRVEIYTDVSGVMTADPRISNEATLLRQVTYQEVVELAHLGARVIHPRAVELAMAAGVELWIKGTDSKSEGTLITGSPPNGVEISGDKVVTGIAHIQGLAQVWVDLDQSLPACDQHLAIFTGLADDNISVDIINVFCDRVIFAVQEPDVVDTERVLAKLGYQPQCQWGFSKVSAVGAGMRGVPGVMARIVRALHQAEVEIFQSVDSHANISCLVRSDRLREAVQALHSEFSLTRNNPQF